MKKLTIVGLLAALLCVTPVTAFASDGENECRHERVSTVPYRVVVHQEEHLYTAANGLTAACQITVYEGYDKTICLICGEVTGQSRNTDYDHVAHSVCGH